MKSGLLLFWLVAAAAAATPVLEPPEGLLPAVADLVEEGISRVAAAPDDADRWGDYGNRLLANQLSSQALDAFRRAHQLDPGNPEWPARLAFLNAENSDLDAAAFLVAVALEADPDRAALHFFAGNVQEALGRYDLALSSYREALRLLPDAFEAEYAIGRLLLNLQRHRESRVFLERAQQAAPRSMAVHATLARLAQAAPELDITLPAAPHSPLESQVALPPPYADRLFRYVRDAEALHFHAARLLNLQRAREALELLDALARYYQDDVTEAEWIDRAHLQAMAGRYDDAIDSYRRCLEQYPESAQARLGLADFELRQNDLTSATLYYEQAEQLATLPEVRARALQGRGRVAALSRDLPAALRLLQGAVAESPSAAVIHMDLVRVLADMKRIDEALVHLDRAQSLGFPVPAGFRELLLAADAR